jgi:hypothetical protein
MKLYGLLMLIILFLLQATNETIIDIYRFILIFFGIILLIIILAYILLTSKQE